MAKSTEEKVNTVLVFNAELQRETGHTVDVDGNGEIVVTCTETGRFLKFPKGTEVDDLKDLLKEHARANKGQISVEAIEAEKQKIIDGLKVGE